MENTTETQPKKQLITPAHILFLIVFIAFLIALVYIVINHERERSNPHALQVMEKRYEDSLGKYYQVVIKQAQLDSQQRANTIVIIRDSLNSLQAQLNENQNEISQIQNQAVTKIKYVNTLSDDSMSLYFLSIVRNGYHKGN